MSQYGPMGETIRRGSRPLSSKMIREAMESIARSAPRKVGDGPAAFPATTTLDRQPFKWDVNCFYRRLGLEASATRLDIVRRFLDLDPRQDFIRLATAAEVLLNKEKRSRYDALPLGTFWGADPDLIKPRLSGDLGGVDTGSWAVYADPNISDEDALSLTSDWRNRLTAELAPHFAKYPEAPQIGVGVCSSIFTSRWEQVGYFAVYFVPLACEATPEYIHAAAKELLDKATLTSVEQWQQ